MNITHTIPKILENRKAPFENNTDTWREVVRRRMMTFRGFAAIEVNNGCFIRPKVSISTAKGQEIIRLLCFRFLEETAESLQSDLAEHYKEELIDAINYLMSVPLLDKEIFDPNRLALECYYAADDAEKVGYDIGPITYTELGRFTELVGGTLGDTFRNRAWMNNPQDIYFAGTTTFYRIFHEILLRILRAFQSFDEFIVFFTAKDDVLQFRLQTKY